MILDETFISLVVRYGDDHQQGVNLWMELVERYSEAGRYYHNLNHLEHLLSELIPYKHELRDNDAVLFALYYHDAVYNVLSNDNEEKSAALAEERMISLRVPPDRIKACMLHILATKAHIPSEDGDANLFIDADLSILGQCWDTYSTYQKQVRQEYAIFPDTLYNAGRRRVLEHFLAMPSIFKTPPFYDKYEHQARVNIRRELDSSEIRK